MHIVSLQTMVMIYFKKPMTYKSAYFVTSGILTLIKLSQEIFIFYFDDVKTSLNAVKFIQTLEDHNLDIKQNVSTATITKYIYSFGSPHNKI